MCGKQLIKISGFNVRTRVKEPLVHLSNPPNTSFKFLSSTPYSQPPLFIAQTFKWTARISGTIIPRRLVRDAIPPAFRFSYIITAS